MTLQPDTILPLLREKAARKRLRLGIFYRGNPILAESIIAEGHRTIIMSDRFRPLYRLYSRIPKTFDSTVVAIETRFDALPISQGSLDGIILTRGLPGSNKPVETLRRLRQLLAPEGLILWPHPVTEGARGRVSKKLVPSRMGTHRAHPRYDICAWLMSAGYKEIGQHCPKGEGLWPWIITTAIARGTL